MISAACASTASREALDFDQQHRRAILGKSGVDVILDRAKRESVQHLARGRSDRPHRDLDDGFRRVVERVVHREQRFHRLRLAHQSHGDFRDERERSFGADKQAAQVVARSLDALAADAHNFAVGQNQFEARDVIGRHSVGQRVRAAGIFGDVSADGARFLAGRIGREIQAQMLDRAGQVEIHDSGLNNRAKIRRINFENAVHARERDHDAAVARNRSAGKSRARAAPHDRSFIAIGEAHDPGDVARGGREKRCTGEIPAPPTRHIRTASNLRARTGPPWARAVPRVRG